MAQSFLKLELNTSRFHIIYLKSLQFPNQPDYFTLLFYFKQIQNEHLIKSLIELKWLRYKFEILILLRPRLVVVNSLLFFKTFEIKAGEKNVIVKLRFQKYNGFSCAEN